MAEAKNTSNIQLKDHTYFKNRQNQTTYFLIIYTYGNINKHIVQNLEYGYLGGCGRVKVLGMDMQILKGESNILLAQLIFGNLVFILPISYHILIHHKYSQLCMLHFITLTHF